MKTERVTIRLPAAMIQKMDALVDLGQYGTKTEVIRHALRDFLEVQGSKADVTVQSEEKMQKLLKLAALAKEHEDLFQSL